MDDLKLFAKNQDQIDSLVQSVYFFSKDNKMEFRKNKCRVLVLERGKVVNLNRFILPNGQMMRKFDEKEYKYPGIMEMDKIKKMDPREKLARKKKRRLKLVLQ